MKSHDLQWQPTALGVPFDEEAWLATGTGFILGGKEFVWTVLTSSLKLKPNQSAATTEKTTVILFQLSPLDTFGTALVLH